MQNRQTMALFIAVEGKRNNIKNNIFLCTLNKIQMFNFIKIIKDY